VKVRIGTRGSALARAQAEWVAARLREMGHEPELHVLRTTGDVTARPLDETGLGIFVAEIEQALRRGDVSLAVHSLKDLPTGEREGLVVAAIPEREDPRDALVTATGATLAQLPAGGRLATGSPRRAGQLCAHRPDLTFVPVRGNVDTRLRKLEEGQFEGLVLACAGLVRLGLAARITERIPLEVSLPAPGQGALAAQVRADDAETRTLVAALDHAPTRAAVTAERECLAHLTGGCIVPVGALGVVEGDRLRLSGVIAHPSGTPLYRAEEEGPAGEAEGVGRALAVRLSEMGGARILEECG